VRGGGRNDYLHGIAQLLLLSRVKGATVLRTAPRDCALRAPPRPFHLREERKNPAVELAFTLLLYY